MLQKQGLVTPIGLRKDTKHRIASLRLLSGLLVGTGIAVILTLIEIGLLFLFNPFHLLGSTVNRLTALSTLATHTPEIFLVPLGELLIISIIALIVAEPIALISYLRAAHRAQ